MSAVIETKIWMALRERIASVVASPIVWPLDTFKLDPTTQQVIVSWSPNVSTRPNLANDSTHYYEGILTLGLMSPLNWTLEQVMQSAALLVNAFPESLRLEYDGVRVHIMKRGDIATTYRDENMWRTPINIRWGQFGG